MSSIIPHFAYDMFISYEWNLAHVYIINGSFNLAMDEVERLFTLPGQFSSNTLTASPDFDLIRNLPRFQEILNTKHKTSF